MHRLDRRRLLQVQRHRSLAAVEVVEPWLDRDAQLGRARALDADDLGTHVRQHHAAERHRADSGELHYTHARERLIA